MCDTKEKTRNGSFSSETDNMRDEMGSSSYTDEIYKCLSTSK